jgi:DhnA family fructose-bisphosphate aldolase class Ia
LLVRSDWSNVARDESFPLPWKRMTHVTLTGAKHAAFLGAAGIVASFYVGYRDDGDEANNLEAVSNLAGDCSKYGLPLFVEAVPAGERISDHNYLDSIKMSARMSLEAGADAVIVPFAGSDSGMGEIVEASGTAPVILNLGAGDDEAARSSLGAGVRGVVLGAQDFEPGAVSALREMGSAGKGA